MIFFVYFIQLEQSMASSFCPWLRLFGRGHSASASVRCIRHWCLSGHPASNHLPNRQRCDQGALHGTGTVPRCVKWRCVLKIFKSQQYCVHSSDLADVVAVFRDHGHAEAGLSGYSCLCEYAIAVIGYLADDELNKEWFREAGICEGESYLHACMIKLCSI